MSAASSPRACLAGASLPRARLPPFFRADDLRARVFALAAMVFALPRSGGCLSRAAIAAAAPEVDPAGSEEVDAAIRGTSCARGGAARAVLAARGSERARRGSAGQDDRPLPGRRERR